ncbi:sigma-E processing peptidase SpoIIGA [Parablautia muri]|uniref:sigma-E processing peptidase SpoIIGA n=1 Tax=Parablautia muri TaxID=2320879 RepID=UPI001367CB2A
MQLQGTIYIDSIFLLNMVMDLYLLSLTARVLGKTATCSRIFAGSVTGAAGYCIMLCLPKIPYVLKVLLGMVPIGMLMIRIACRVKSFGELLRGLGYLYFFSFLLGGFIIFLNGRSNIFTEYGDSTMVLAGLGFVGFAICRRLITVCQGKRKEHFCRVSIPGDQGPITVAALIDTGNGLVEPVSRKPVAILEAKEWENLKLWMKPEKYKIIPYHSIGKNSGLLEGYEIDIMNVQGSMGEKQYEKVIVAVFQGKISQKGSYQMVLPPELSI